MQACIQYPCGRLMVIALLAWAVVWGTSPSARAQEDPARAPEGSLVWQGEQYLCEPVEPERVTDEQYLCTPVEPGHADVVELRKAMSTKCEAGDCAVECGGGKGCACIAESDTPSSCTCICTGGETSGGVKLAPATRVDVCMDGLTLFEAAVFLDALATETTIVVPRERRNEPVFLDLQQVPFEEVLKQLGLTPQ